MRSAAISRCSIAPCSGKPLAYLDNAASSQRPRAVIEAMSRYYETTHANVHRGVHTLSQEATDLFEGAREKVRRFINARSVKEIIFVRGTTEAVNLVAQSFGRPRFGPGDEILISWLEHHANIVPWQLLCEQTGATLKVAPITQRGEVDYEGFAALLSPRTRLVALAHVSNALGTVVPVQRFIARGQGTWRPGAARRRAGRAAPQGRRAGARLRLLLLLGPQDVRTDRHGRAVRARGAAARDAAMAGRRGHDPRRDVREDALQRPAAQVRGRHARALPTPIGLGAAIDYLESLGMDRIAAAEHGLARLRHGQARGRSPGCASSARHPQKAAVVSFTLERIHPHDLGTILDHEGVAIRTGHHCAMPVMDFFKVPATARASFAFYNTRAEVDQLVSGAAHGTGDAGLMDLKDLYRDVIVDHNRHPRNFREMPDADRQADGFNPLCGDKLTLYVKIDGDRIEDVSFRRQRLRDLGRLGLAADGERQGPHGAPRRSSSSARCTTC